MDSAPRKKENSKDFVGQIAIGLAVAILTGLFFVTSHAYEVNFLKYVGVPNYLAVQVAELDMTVYFTLLSTIGGYLLLLLLLAHYEFSSKRFRTLIRNKPIRISLLVVSLIALVATSFLPVEDIWLRISAIASYIGLFTFICLAFPVLADLARYFNFREEKMSSIALLMIAFSISLWGLFPMVMDNFAKSRAASFKTESVYVNSKEYELVRYYSSKILLKKEGYFLVISTEEAGLVEFRDS